MIKIPKKSLENDWVDVPESDGKQRLRIDYPTGEQNHILQDMGMKAFSDGEMDMGEFMKFARFYIKCTVKDWEGIGVDCKLKGDYLSDESWYILTDDIPTAQILYGTISKALKWDDVEKKG